MSAHNHRDSDELLLLRASSKRLFETLMEETSDRIYIKDKASRFVNVSRSMVAFSGAASRDEMFGKSDFDLFSDEHAKQAYDDEQRIMETGEQISGLVEKETWPDGRVTWASSTKVPIHLNSGKIVGMLGISRDITDLVVAQQKLAENERLLRQQNERMISDYKSAHRVQEVMIPGRRPNVDGIKAAFVWKPMSAVGGDIINFPRNPAGYLLFFLGDVCGHGITAAFYTVLLKYLTDHFGENYKGDPKAFLDGLNSEIVGRFQDGFITGLSGHFERGEEGQWTLHLAHAGHRQVLVWRQASGAMKRLELPTGTVLGLPGRESSAVERIVLEPGDRFYAFTDGMVEACNPKGDEFGLPALEQEFSKHAAVPIEEALQRAFRTVCAYTGSYEQQDDISIVAFEIE